MTIPSLQDRVSYVGNIFQFPLGYTFLITSFIPCFFASRMQKGVASCSPSSWPDVLARVRSGEGGEGGGGERERVREGESQSAAGELARRLTSSSKVISTVKRTQR